MDVRGHLIVEPVNFLCNGGRVAAERLYEFDMLQISGAHFSVVCLLEQRVLVHYAIQLFMR